MFQELKKQVESLNKVEIEIVAVGEYPTKAGTKVQDVAIYQNDGTERISPAKFVEEAERRNNGWETEIDTAFAEWMEGDETGMARAGRKMADDINAAVNRIKTGRLRESMRAIVKK